MFYASIILAILLITSEVIAYRKNKITKSLTYVSTYWSIINRWKWIIGIVLAFLSFCVMYPFPVNEEIITVIGFPLVASALDESGRNYVGPLTMPFAIINALIWYFIPSIVLMLWTFLYSKKWKEPNN